jgi:Mg-chelatase subunit ChlD
LSLLGTADEVVQEIRNLQYIGGLTAVGEGIKEGAKQADPARGARPNLANKIMVVFTDGWNNKGSDPGQEAAAARAAGFRILTVGVTVSISTKLETNYRTFDPMVFLSIQ